MVIEIEIKKMGSSATFFLKLRSNSKYLSIDRREF